MSVKSTFACDDNNPLLDILVRFQRGEIDLETAHREIAGREVTVKIPQWCVRCGEPAVEIASA